MRGLTATRTVTLTTAVMVSRVAAAAFTLPLEPDCKAHDAFKKVQNVVFLDRTSNPDEAGKGRYRTGIDAILSNHEYVGRLSVLEIRENETQTAKLGEGCLDAPDQQASIQREPDGRIATMWRYLVTTWHEWRRNSRTVAEQEADTQALRYIQEDRGKAAVAIGRLIETNYSTERDTEIARSLMGVLQSECSGKVTCNVFMFSDLLDTDVKRAYAERRNMEAAGKARAESLMSEFLPRLTTTKVFIKVWGFGRADDLPGTPLSDEKRQNIRNYWRGYFEVIRRYAAVSSQAEITDMY